MLGAAKQDVAADRSFQPGLEASVVIQQHHGLTFISEAVHQPRRHQDVAEADQSVEVVQGHAQTLFPVHVNTHGAVLQMRIGIGTHDVEGV